jgi:hypothetical protein
MGFFSDQSSTISSSGKPKSHKKKSLSAVHMYLFPVGGVPPRIDFPCKRVPPRPRVPARNPNWNTWPNFAKLTYLSVFDSRDGVSELSPSPSPPSSLTHVHSIQSHTLPTSTLLNFTCTQVPWCLACLTRPRASGVTMTPNTGRTIFSTESSALVFSLSSHRQSYTGLIFSSRFMDS